MAAIPASNLIAALLLVLAWLGLCLWTWHRWQRRHRPGDQADPGDSRAILVLYASQTGFAEEIARQSADALRTSGAMVRLMPLGAVDVDLLSASDRALFIVSTTGEGDAPDDAAGFVRKVMAGGGRIVGGLDYALLALGDRSYRHFCGFGHQLDDWLRRHGGRPRCDMIEVDQGDPGALRRWQANLRLFGASASVPDWTPPSYGAWRLTRRIHVNPGSPGAPMFLLRLEPEDGRLPEWRAGDIAEIGPCNDPAAVSRLLAQIGRDGDADLARRLATSILPDPAAAPSDPARLLDTLRPLPHRDYSIASLPTDGAVELLVRQTIFADGTLGLGSGWLTLHVPVGGTIALRIRDNRGFHPPPDAADLILIGNGTGIAGLRAHLKHRERHPGGRNWLLFGERTAAHDRPFGDDIAQWRDSGLLTRLDLVFSREGEAHGYVQHRLAAAGADVARWVEDGAAIYVCGSLDGMGTGVADALAAILGEERLAALLDAGRYRRDLY